MMKATRSYSLLAIFVAFTLLLGAPGTQMLVAQDAAKDPKTPEGEAPKGETPETSEAPETGDTETPEKGESPEGGDETTAGTDDAKPAVAPGAPKEIQLSFKSVDVDFLVNWLAEMTGKTVVKHKDVKCQLTIMSPNKLPIREALELVYRSLSLEGFSAVENGNVIMLVPEALERKLSPVRVFQLKYAKAAKIKTEVTTVLSDKAKVQVDDRANKLLITDTAERLKMAEDLIRQLDVSTDEPTVTVVLELKEAKAEDLLTILQTVYRNPAAKPPQKGKPAPPASLLVGVRFMADKISNRIIVTTPPDRLEGIKALIATLDVETPADVTVRILGLQHVDATDLVDEISPMFAKLRGSSFKDQIEISANSRSNSLIIMSSLQNYEAIKELVESLDTDDAQQNAMKAFPLQNADAEEVAEHLTELHENQGGRSRYYGYYDYYSSRRRKSGKGQLRFVADRRRNAVVVIGPPGNIDSVKDLIKSLDEPVTSDALVPRIYQLKFVSAFDVEELLNELFAKKERRRGYYDWDYGSEDTKRDIGRLYGKVRITSEFYTNSIIVTSNSEENFQAIEDILKKLDVPSDSGDTTLTIRLRYANAVTVANNVNIIFAGGGSPPRRGGNRQPQNNTRRPPQTNNGTTLASNFELEEDIVEEAYYPWLGSAQRDPRSRSGRTTRPVSDLVGKVRIVADNRTNALLITSNAHHLPEVLKVVNDLDVPTAQVLLEAKIVEVSTDLRDRLGVRWSPNGDATFSPEDLDNSLSVGGGAEYSEVFAGTLLQDAVRTGVLNANANLDLLVQFLRKNTDSRVRAEPRINVENNERGKIFVGSRVPFIAGSIFTPQGGRNDSFQYVDVGIILEVTPHINEDGDVSLGVRVESSQIRQGETLFGGAIIDTRNYRTDLTVKSDETRVLGGIIQTEQSEVIRKIPFLGDIPLLGWLFRKKDSVNREVELMVFLKATVTRSEADAQELMRRERERTRNIRSWENKLDWENRQRTREDEEEQRERDEERAEEEADWAEEDAERAVEEAAERARD
ncbi:MAG: secretin N-terminal domain-containing protein [Planctomycetota bacterium]